MTPNAMALVTRPLAANASAHPYDVLKMKSILAALGHYEAPEWGLSQFPDPALFDALRAFQNKRGLKVDGVMKPGGETEETLLSTLNVGQAGTAIRAAAAALQEMGQGGDEILAHITPEEAQWLDAITDGASVNPHTGLLEFWFDHEAHAYGVGDRKQNSGPDRPDGRGDGGRRYTEKQLAGAERANQEAARTRDKVRDYLGRKDKADGDRNGGNAKDIRAQRGGADTLGNGNGMVKQNDIDVAMRANDKEARATQARRSQAVLAPDNDPSFTSGFFEEKAISAQPVEDASGVLAKMPKDRRYTNAQLQGAARANEEAARTSDKVREYLGRSIQGGGGSAENQHEEKSFLENLWGDLSNVFSSSQSPRVTVDIPKTQDEEILLEKAKRLGIDPGLIDLKNDFDRAFIDSYYGFKGKNEKEKDEAIQHSQELSRKAQNDERYREIKKQFNRTLGNAGRPGWGGYGVMSDEQLRRVRDYSYGFGVPMLGLLAARKPSPAGVFIRNGYLANDELENRKKLEKDKLKRTN